MATARKPAVSSEAEWQARQQLAACYRIFAHMGWDELIYNHISLRVPGEENAFLINPFGLHYSEVNASNLVKIDIDGNKLDDSNYPVNRAGFVQHSVFHAHVPDAHCIIHTHTTAGMAVASTQEGLLPTNFYAGFIVGNIAYHDFEGVTVRPAEGPRLVANLGDRRFMILRNHGLLVMAKTLPEAFLRYYVFERACQIQVATQSAGTPRIIPDEVLTVHQRDMFSIVASDHYGVPDFQAMVRVIDRIDPSWRE